MAVASLQSGMDWRVRWILIAVGVALAATIGIYWLGYGRDPGTFFGAIFAAWIGGLALFVITGILVVIISLARPETESFDARARILFRRQDGKHIDYIVSRMKEVFEQYAEITTIRVSIKQYHEEERKFLLGIQDTITLRSYIDDVETIWQSGVDYFEITAPPAGGQSNRLVYVRVNDAPITSVHEFAADIKYPVSTRIPRNSSCKIEYLVEYWIKANDESNSHDPIRYNQKLDLYFENLTGKDVVVQVTQDGQRWVDLPLLAGEAKCGLALEDVLPNKNAYEFRVKAP